MTADFIQLSRLLAVGRWPHSPVSVDAERVVDWLTFAAHVGRLRALLDSRSRGRWLIFTESTYAFAVALMAVWQARSQAVIAPNGRPGTLSELRRGTHGLISDRAPIGLGPDCLDALHDTGAVEHGWIVPDRSTPCLELATSGSTGDAKRVPKTLANLEDEVAGLERQWGARLGTGEIFGTVSHQHIYGLLFRVLWPLAAGRIFRAQTYLHPAELGARMAQAGACALVASPTHLSRLKGFHGLERMATSCHTIFSSGSPLDRATAMAVRAVFGAAPFEIFGSTETGGVAWRQQDPGDDSLSWTLFSGVIARQDANDGLLTVRSPFVSGRRGELTMADCVDFLVDGRIVLGPRGDRTVKLGDRRLSLPDMEAVLHGHAFVAQAACTVLDHGPERRLAAAVVLTPAGRRALAREGRRAMSQSLMHAIEPYWDRILLPKVWRYVTRLPEDAQGKVTVGDLRPLFATPYDSAISAPELLAESSTETTRQQTLRVPETLGYLDGHFPEFPVVPGVVQIQWVMDVARAMAGNAMILERIEALKFKGLLRPGDVFQLFAEMSAQNSHLAFRLWNDRSLFASGRCLLTFAPSPAT